MTQEQFPPLQEFIQGHWATFSDFATHINTEPQLFLEGEGCLFLQKSINSFLFKDTFHLFGINKNLYAASVKEDRESKKKYFDGLYQLDKSVLTSQTFREAQQQNYNSRYKPLGTQLEIECKSYDYHDEHKLLFSKAHKVDLLYSHQLVLNSDASTTLKVTVHPSLKQAVQYQKMVDQVNERTAEIIAKKSKK